MVNKTIDKDLGFKKILSEMKKAEGSFVTIGIHQKEGEDEYDNGAPITLVGAVHEFGTDNVPKRSWLRSTFDENRKDWMKLTKQLYDKVLTGKSTTEKVLQQLGIIIAEKVKAKFKSGDPNWPSLKEKTRARKSSPRTLVDSWKLHNSINSEVKIKK